MQDPALPTSSVYTFSGFALFSFSRFASEKGLLWLVQLLIGFTPSVQAMTTP